MSTVEFFKNTLYPPASRSIMSISVQICTKCRYTSSYGVSSRRTRSKRLNSTAPRSWSASRRKLTSPWTREMQVSSCWGVYWTYWTSAIQGYFEHIEQQPFRGIYWAYLTSAIEGYIEHIELQLLRDMLFILTSSYWGVTCWALAAAIETYIDHIEQQPLRDILFILTSSYWGVY